ncbi:M23 family metallopeptidase [Tissierella creatinophila]|uniref:Peptidase family M23 n=1 Tax=Tissierella creatinophila DSM 6911 TaxID=1123403 RepID=A0A1U7M7V0_TISCR|nr:M23 family metallopeptidase [Tissierella creatinophila]OLS03330.1 peptidase family M23 [Tissierella creatinophila DSM 6911]
MKTKIKKHLNNLNINRLKTLKPVFYKIIFSLVVILCVLTFKALNFKSTKWVLSKIKYTIEYETDLRSSGKEVYRKVQGLVKDSKNVLTVFNLDSKVKYPLPIKGELYRSYEKDINEGIDIKSTDENDPKSIITGRVKDIYLQEKQGYFVIIEQEKMEITYGYLSKSYVSKGDSIDTETPIGSLGTNKDGNKYLRIELKVDGRYKNPLDYIDVK